MNSRSSQPSTDVIDVHDGAELAELLLSPARTAPVVVISWHPGFPEEQIDAAEVARGAAGWADVYRIENGPQTWALQSKLGSERLSVYGNAGRVYPGGREWMADESRSPLRLVMHLGPETAGLNLIRDARSMGPARTVVESAPSAGPQKSAAAFKGAFGDGASALACLENGTTVQILAEDVVPGVRLDWIYAPGQQLTGTVDRSTNRFRPEIVRAELRAAKLYTEGQVVLALVVSVAADHATLRLWPGLDRRLPLEAVSSNPHDTVDLLLEPGDVVAARVSFRGGPLSLSVLDVDEDEEVASAPALLQGGIPWLEPGRHAHGRTAAAADSRVPTGPAATAEAQSAAQRPQPGPKGQTALKDALLTIEALSAKVGTPQDASAARADAEALRAALAEAVAARAAVEQEADQLAGELRELRAEKEQLRTKATELRTALRSKERRLGRSEDPADSIAARFADDRQRFHHEVYLAWVRVVAPVDKQSVQCPAPGSYELGPLFLESLGHRHVAPKREAVLDAVVRALVDDRRYSASLDLHPLRTGEGGNDPQVAREDKAVMWRASVQRQTAAALRLHYWLLPDRRIELECVNPHDEGI